MSTLVRRSALPEIDYPTSDGKPMAETEIHGQIMTDSREIVVSWFEEDPMIYVWGNLLIFYEEGNPRKHLSPDVFVVHGVPKRPPREHYLVWKEGKFPQGVLEITSKTTAKEDQEEKLRIYREVWRVQEYFMFDPRSEYLKPSLQGHRLRGNRYVRIKAVEGRLPSEVFGLHFEGEGQRLRFYDPNGEQYLVTARERNVFIEAARRQSELALQQSELARRQSELARHQAEAAVETLRQEIEALRQQLAKKT